MSAQNDSRAQSQAQYEKMTGTPIPRLVLTLAAPTVVSMLVSSIYNMADTFFVSQLGTSASGAVGVVFSLVISMLHPSELDKRLGMDLEHTLPLWQRSNQRQLPQDKAN